MANPPPPPSSSYSVGVVSLPNSKTPLAFNSPVATRFSPQRSPQDQFPTTSTPSPSTPSPANGMKVWNSAPHLSTPPGPPVFSSPLRPVSVPFRSSFINCSSLFFRDRGFLA
ncbi:hypothetical protein FRX31_002904 [Thalictrum thalictroides]|uniref:Uncharacterized protein n=1 Tax=Thalictrum thalictroides TaxID=46969 RepID=A0A7J6XD89_THATH|nr:hypothetical protein FRX31_002904 [Thalictrum thalictroides]